MFHGKWETKVVKVSENRQLGVVLKYTTNNFSANKSTQSDVIPTHFLRETYMVSKFRHFFVTLKFSYHSASNTQVIRFYPKVMLKQYGTGLAYYIVPRAIVPLHNVGKKFTLLF
jgi:hypothetical protein